MATLGKQLETALIRVQELELRLSDTVPRVEYNRVQRVLSTTQQFYAKVKNTRRAAMDAAKAEAIRTGTTQLVLL